MELGRLLAVASFFGLAAGAYADAQTAHTTPGKYDPKTLVQVQALYGLSEDGAVTRLAKEYEAAEQARRIEDRQLPSYAGSWFDSKTQTLHVAISNGTDAAAVRKSGAVPVLVGHSLAELEAARDSIASELVAELGAGNVRESYVDVQANGLVLGISKSKIDQASASKAARARVDVPVHFQVAADNIEFSSNVYGADATKNATWIALDGLAHPCSVGANAEKVNGTTYVAGFATAGHCGELNNAFQIPSGTSLGTVKQSEMVIGFSGPSYPTTPHVDGAWVQTDAGWVTVPQVNGYSDGNLNVSGTWAGLLVAPVGTTACRYGGTSGGPHCHSVTALNVTVTVSGTSFPGMIKVSGICTEAGDSGGPLIAPSGQVQGTVTGGATGSTCPDNSTDTVYFEPMPTILARAGTKLSSSVAMLTSHGRSAPTIGTLRCPDPANSGEHIYECFISDYDSQGLTSTSWTTNTGASSTTTELSGTCLTGQVVNVTLTVANPYGTTTRTPSFTCPINPLP